MLRGYRWQLLALLLSAVLFVVSLTLRSSEPTPSVPPTTTSASSSSGATTTPDNIVIPPPSISDVQAVPPVAPASTNGVYREALVGKIQRLNPLLADLNPVDRDITSLIFEGLTKT